MASRNNSRFQSGTYKCGACGKLTRETGDGEQALELCAFCLHEAELENSLSDGNISEEEFAEALSSLKQQYGRAANPNDQSGKALVPSTNAAPTKEHHMSRKPTAKSIKAAVEKHFSTPTAAPAKKAPVKAPARTSAERRASAVAATRTVMVELIKAGWTLETIADEMGSTPGCPVRWIKGRSACKELPSLQKLLVKAATKATSIKKSTSGSLKLPRVAVAARMGRVRLEDPKQLVLALQDLQAAISAVLAGGQ